MRDSLGPGRMQPGDAPDPALLLALLRSDELDAALDAGLMALDVEAAGGLDPASRALLAGAQQRLRAAWDARERHRARAARLARHAAERERRRAAPATVDSQPGPAANTAPAAPAQPLPAAAAAALARARARAQRP